MCVCVCVYFLPLFLLKILPWLPVQLPRWLRKLCGEFLRRPPGVAVEQAEPPLRRDRLPGIASPSRVDLSARHSLGRSSAVLCEGSARAGLRTEIGLFQVPRAQPPQLSRPGLGANRAPSRGARPAPRPGPGSCSAFSGFLKGIQTWENTGPVTLQRAVPPPGLTSWGEEGCACSRRGGHLSQPCLLTVPWHPHPGRQPRPPEVKSRFSSCTHVDACSSPVTALSPQTDLAQPRLVCARILSDGMQRRVEGGAEGGVGWGGARAAFNI